MVQAVTASILAITDNNDLSSAIGLGTGILCGILILAYGSIWVGDPEDIVLPPDLIQRPNAQAEHKLQTAALRMGSVLAIIGCATATLATNSKVVITVVTICCAVFGGLIGSDVKRRIRRSRE